MSVGHQRAWYQRSKLYNLRRNIISKEDNIAKHRLGKARQYLNKIKDYKIDYYEDYDDAYIYLKHLAETALKEMEKIK